MFVSNTERFSTVKLAFDLALIAKEFFYGFLESETCVYAPKKSSKLKFISNHIYSVRKFLPFNLPVSSYLGALKRLEIQIASTLFSVKSSNLACGSHITLEIFSSSQLFDDVIIFADIVKKNQPRPHIWECVSHKPYFFDITVQTLNFKK